MCEYFLKIRYVSMFFALLHNRNLCLKWTFALFAKIMYVRVRNVELRDNIEIRHRFLLTFRAQSRPRSVFLLYKNFGRMSEEGGGVQLVQWAIKVIHGTLSSGGKTKGGNGAQVVHKCVVVCTVGVWATKVFVSMWMTLCQGLNCKENGCFGISSLWRLAQYAACCVTLLICYNFTFSHFCRACRKRNAEYMWEYGSGYL